MARKQITELSAATTMFADDLLYKREGAIDKRVSWDVARKSVFNKTTLSHDFGTISAGAVVEVDTGIALSSATDYFDARGVDMPSGILTSLRVVSTPDITAYLVVHNATASPIVVGTIDIVVHH